MKEQLITYKTAKLAKEKRFNEDCQFVFTDKGEEYNNKIPSTQIPNNYHLRPSQSLLQKWLRDIHKIDISILIVAGDNYGAYIHKDRNKQLQFEVHITYENQHTIYEETLERALLESLRLIK